MSSLTGHLKSHAASVRTLIFGGFFLTRLWSNYRMSSLIRHLKVTLQAYGQEFLELFLNTFMEQRMSPLTGRLESHAASVRTLISGAVS